MIVSILKTDTHRKHVKKYIIISATHKKRSIPFREKDHNLQKKCKNLPKMIVQTCFINLFCYYHAPIYCVQYCGAEEFIISINPRNLRKSKKQQIILIIFSKFVLVVFLHIHVSGKMLCSVNVCMEWMIKTVCSCAVKRLRISLMPKDAIVLLLQMLKDSVWNTLVPHPKMRWDEMRWEKSSFDKNKTKLLSEMTW